MHEVLVNRLGGLSLPKKSVVRLTDRPDMTLDVNNNTTTSNFRFFCFCCWVYYTFICIYSMNVHTLSGVQYHSLLRLISTVLEAFNN